MHGMENPDRNKMSLCDVLTAGSEECWSEKWFKSYLST